MQIFKIVLLALLLTGVHAKGVKWQKLKEIEKYSGSDYNLKEGVEYLEVRQYVWRAPQKVNKNNYSVPVSAYKIPLKSFESKIVKKFKNLAPNFTKQANIRNIGYCYMSGCTSSLCNGFMIDNNGKFWSMNEVGDVINFLGEIDTPAEVKLVLWLNKEAHEDKYSKTSKGYTVISEYDNSIDNFGECGYFTYRLRINRRGKITEKKLLKKGPSKDGCLTGD